MQKTLARFILRTLCEALGAEEATKLFKNIFGSMKSVDPKAFAATLGLLLGYYKPEKKAIERYFRCVDMSEVLGIPDEEGVIVLGVDPDRTTLHAREKEVFPAIISKLGIDIFEKILQAVKTKFVDPREAQMALHQIEQYRKSFPDLDDIFVSEGPGELYIGLVYKDAERAKKLKEANTPGVFTYIYANLYAEINGYKGAKFKRIDQVDSAAVFVFELIE